MEPARRSHTLFVGSLPAAASSDRLQEIFSEVGPVKQCFVVKEKGADKCRGFGYVTFSMEEDAQRALKEVKEYDGQKLSLQVAKKKLNDRRKPGRKESAPKSESESTLSPTLPAAAATAAATAAAATAAAAPQDSEQKAKGFRKTSLRARLIIRNLSFKCSEEDLKQVFAKFGRVLESKIPLKPDGKKRGFAFVLFKNVSQASAALKAMNLKEIKGRQVAVDWAVARDKFVATHLATSGSGSKKSEEAAVNQAESDDEDEDEDEQRKQTALGEKNKNKKMQKEEEEDEEEEEEEAGEESQSDDEEEEDSKEKDDDDDDDDDEEEEDDADKSSLGSADDQDESEDDEEIDEDEDEPAGKKARRRDLPSDVNQGRTIFIRNLSFDTEEDGLEEVLLRYGELNYVKVVFHPDTGHSKGCAFAQFKSKEAADRCLAAAGDEAESGGIRVDGRKLLIVAAVTKEDATKLKVDKVKVETGTRNLYLAREGLIRAGTTAAEGVPEADMIKRARFEEIKRTKLRDINVFVSKTRLCVHNLPKSVDDRKLRALCLQALGGTKRVRITECRVMYDRKPERGQVMGQSLGYGFVQFQDHQHALSTLRHLNNNPDIFSPHKRPIVEFSLEDSRKLQMKEERQQKNKEYFRKQNPRSQTPRDGSKGGFKPLSSSEPQTVGRAPPGNLKRNRYSGFQSNPEVEHVDLENGKKRRKVLPFPSKRGPKIRMRDKGKPQAPAVKRVRGVCSRKDRQRRQPPAAAPRNQVKAAKKRDRDGFDSLVEQYKKKLTAATHTHNTKRNRWFH